MEWAMLCRVDFAIKVMDGFCEALEGSHDLVFAVWRYGTDPRFLLLPSLDAEPEDRSAVFESADCCLMYSYLQLKKRGQYVNDGFVAYDYGDVPEEVLEMTGEFHAAGWNVAILFREREDGAQWYGYLGLRPDVLEDVSVLDAYRDCKLSLLAASRIKVLHEVLRLRSVFKIGQR